jgi:hypothetical protein
MTDVWRLSQSKGNDRLCLLALADKANDQGYCWPGITDIQTNMNCERQTTLDCLDRLESTGDLYSRRIQRKGSFFLVLVGLSDDVILKALKTHFKMNDEVAQQTLEAVHEKRNKSRDHTSKKDENLDRINGAKKSRDHTKKVYELDQNSLAVRPDPSLNVSNHQLDDVPSGSHPGDIVTIPEKPRKRNEEFDALATVWFEVPADTAEFAALGGRIGQHVAWLRGKPITVKRNGTKTVVPGCTYKITSGVLEQAKKDWYRQNPSAHHPTDVLKFVQHIDRFCRHLSELSNGNGGLLPADPNCPKCAGMGAYTSNGVLIPVCECRKGATNGNSAA